RKLKTENAAKDREIERLTKSLIIEEQLNAALTARIKELDRCHEGTIDLCNQKTVKIKALEAKLAAAQKALEPFAEYGEDYFDKDYNGKPLPDKQGVGWVYLNYGHFRKA